MFWDGFPGGEDELYRDVFGGVSAKFSDLVAIQLVSITQSCRALLARIYDLPFN